MPENKIVCVGSLNVDITLFVDEFCKDDEERLIQDITQSSGGAAANIASGLGTLEKSAFFFGNIGTDNYTEMLLSDFQKNHVNYSHAKFSKKPNNSCYSLVNRTGERMIYAYNYVDFKASDFPLELFDSSLKYLVFTSLGKKDIVQEYEVIAVNAKKNGTKIIFSPGNIFAKFGLNVIQNLIRLSDILVLSETEFDLLGVTIDFLLKLVPVVIVTKGKKGVDLYEKNAQVQSFKAYLVDDVVDTTGAGDCFLAAFIAQISENKSFLDAIHFAMKAAALSVTKKGARGMPSFSEIKSHFI